MASIAAKQVGIEVLETIRKGKKPNLGKIALKKGYSLKTSLNPKNITETDSYKEVVEPYAQRLQRHQEKILKAMEDKDLNGEAYKVLADSLAKVTHDVQLLTGGSTENLAHKVLVEFIDAESNQDTKGV